MTYSLASIIWPLTALLIGGLQITAAALLLRERGNGPWLMLIGGVISVLGRLGQFAIQIVGTALASDFSYSTILSLSSFSTLGTLLFSIGLLLHALRRRALGSRIAELEAILAATHDARADRP